MSRLLVYYAHPGHRHSHANRAMVAQAREVSDITFVDLYCEYPRFEIDIDREQTRLLEHDVYLLQYPMFWYSAPSMIKEWMDLVLEHGFAYGADGEQLVGKTFMLALTAAGTAEAYTPAGYQHFPIRTFLTPMEQTARLCGMDFVPPYVLYGSIRAVDEGRIEPHAEGYRWMLEAVRDDRFDFDAVRELDVVTLEDLESAGRKN